MSVSSAVESDLASRIRRALAGRVLRMGMRSRVGAAVVLLAAAGVTLPYSGIADAGDGVDWETVKTTTPEEWSAELRAQIAATGRDVDAIAERVRHGMVWREAMATDPDEWSAELKVRLLELTPDSTIEEIAEGIRQRREHPRAQRDGGGPDLDAFDPQQIAHVARAHAPHADKPDADAVDRLVGRGEGFVAWCRLARGRWG